MKIKLNKILCIPVAFILLLAVTVVPAMACSPSAPCGQPSLNSMVGSGNPDNPGDFNVTVTQLTGSDAKKMIAEALNNNDVKKLRGELIRQGYTLERDDASVEYRVTASNDTISIEAYIVSIPFKSHNNNVDASIVWVKDNNKITVQAVLKGSAQDLRTPVDLLKNNQTYNQYKNNYTSQGFTVYERNASVVEVLTADSNKAFVGVTIANSTVSKLGIAGIVDLKNNTVLSVVDIDWGCEACITLVGALCAAGITSFVSCTFMCEESICPWLIPTGIGAIACVAACPVICGALIALGCMVPAAFVCDVAGVC